MSESTSLKANWILTGDALHNLLGWLDPVPERAGEKYEHIRASLIKFFESRGCRTPDERTDQTIDRVARRLSEGIVVHTSNPFLYFYGVALKVLHEDQRRQPAHQIPPPAQNAFEEEARADCMEGCLQRLPGHIVDMLTEYCVGDREERSEKRRAIAERLGVSLNTLRLRVHRLRDQLGSCLNRCLEHKRRTM